MCVTIYVRTDDRKWLLTFCKQAYIVHTETMKQHADLVFDKAYLNHRLKVHKGSSTEKMSAKGQFSFLKLILIHAAVSKCVSVVLVS